MLSGGVTRAQEAELYEATRRLWLCDTPTSFGGVEIFVTHTFKLEWKDLGHLCQNYSLIISY